MPAWVARLPIESEEGEIGVIKWDRLGDLLPVGDVYVPAKLHVQLYGSDTPPAQPSLVMEIAVQQGVPVCTRIEVQAKEGGREVMPKDLLIAKSQMLYWLTEVVASTAQSTAAVDIARVPEWADERTAKRSVDIAVSGSKRKRKISAELLTNVAKLYRANLDGEPIETIARTYGVSSRTAARYVETCRSDEYQLLPKTTQGKKKA